MENLLQKVAQYVTNLLTNELANDYVYHNLTHTQTVVQKVSEIADAEGIDAKLKDILLVAAWFHDVGYTVDKDDHEQHALPIVNAFLAKENVDKSIVNQINELILVTNINATPKTLLEKIIRDADSSHVGCKNFEMRSILLRNEWEMLTSKTFSEKEWHTINIDFLTTKHRFYTNYALNEWSARKAKNLAKVLIDQKKTKNDRAKYLQKKETLTLKKNRTVLPERGIETMFRAAMRNHITLSDIADTKANILLSVNAIIVSLALSNLLPKLDNPSNTHLIIPTVIFILFTIASMVLSVLATRPNVTEGKFTKEDVANKKVNLIFFGNFHKMSLDDFEWAMGEMMKDRDYLYSSLKKDLYFLGLVLNRKYKILRITYTVFMIGIIVSVLAFGFSFSASGRAISLF